MTSFRHLGDSPVYDGYVWRVVVGAFTDPDGNEFTRDIVRSPGAVAVVPLHEDGTVSLLRQYRAAFDDAIVEIPAGMRDVDGEDPIDTARRELVEEIGFDAGRLELLHRFFPSVGMTDSVLHVYLATELTEVGRAKVLGLNWVHDNEELAHSDCLQCCLRRAISGSRPRGCPCRRTLTRVRCIAWFHAGHFIDPSQGRYRKRWLPSVA